jgi:hypothetical protein
MPPPPRRKQPNQKLKFIWTRLYSREFRGEPSTHPLSTYQKNLPKNFALVNGDEQFVQTRRANPGRRGVGNFINNLFVCLGEYQVLQKRDKWRYSAG